MYELSHEQKKLGSQLPIQFKLFFTHSMKYWHPHVCSMKVANTPFLTIYRQKLKDKRPWVGLNHQPFGILSYITALTDDEVTMYKEILDR